MQTIYHTQNLNGEVYSNIIVPRKIEAFTVNNISSV